MDVPQLKLLAGLARGLLEQHNVSIGHAQSLELISALPGLRNWSEVMSFPDRVATCELNLDSAARLSNRLRRKHDLEFNPNELIRALSPPEPGKVAAASLPLIWPTGPKPGVYITTEPVAIRNLLLKYEDASDGAVVYAERAADDWDGSIDLGEYGLSSNGLNRVSSGTLIVVGPLHLNQQSWKECADKLGWACIRAYDSGHRVAVLLDTPMPENLFRDVELLAREGLAEGDEAQTALIGVATEEGDLVEVQPFSTPAETPHIAFTPPSLDAIPAAIIDPLRTAMARRKTGFLTFGTTRIQEHRGIEQIEAALALSADIGPIARVRSRDRSTPAKDWLVPDSIKALPFFPSIQSAYAHGYRRLIVGTGFTRTEEMLKLADEVLFISGVYALNVAQMVAETGRNGGFDHLAEVIAKSVAMVGLCEVETKSGMVSFADMFVPTEQPPIKLGFSEAMEYTAARRIIRWEDELTALLDSKRVSATAAKTAMKRVDGAEEFFKARAAQDKQTKVTVD